jgi:hypothetical protein
MTKTRLSREFKQLVSPKNDDEDTESSDLPFGSSKES